MEKKNVKENVILRPSAEVCNFDARKDAMKVVQGLGVNIDDMLQTGIVKDSGETLDNNGIDNPSDIIGRITDTFDAMDAARIIKKYGKKNPAKAQAQVQDIATPNNNE